MVFRIIRIRVFILFILFNSVFITATSQTGTNSIISQSERWNLDKYVWSHSHHDPTQPDKPVSDFDALDHWESLVTGNNPVSISPNGEYIAYGVSTNYERKLDTLVVQSTMSTWRQALTGVQPGFFSGNSRLYIFQDKENRLCLMQTGSSERRYIKDVASYKLPVNTRNEWLAWQLKDNDQTVVLQNLLSGEERQYPNVSSYTFNSLGAWFCCQLRGTSKELLLYHLTSREEKRFMGISGYAFAKDGKHLLLKDDHNNLSYVSLINGTSNMIWVASDKYPGVSSFSFDQSGEQIVIVAQATSKNNSHGQTENSIWYWKDGMDHAELKADNAYPGIGSGLQIGNSASFTDNDLYIGFTLQAPQDDRKPASDGIQMEVWSYQDELLQSTQAWQLTQSKRTYTGVVNTQNGLVLKLDGEKELMQLSWLRGDYAVVIKEINSDRFWKKDYEGDSAWLISLQDGKHRLLPFKTKKYKGNFLISPNGHYLLYFDEKQGCNYFSCDLYTGKTRNITVDVPSCQFGFQDPYLQNNKNPVQPVQALSIGGSWVGENKLLVYDNYDIWQLDLTGRRRAINITNGYGKLHHIKFEVSGFSGFHNYSEKDTLLLKAFSRITKFNGYFRKILGTPGDPEQLYMGPCYMEPVSYTNSLGGGMPALKAADANTWIVKRETATEAPNYFVTHDFKAYKQVTYLAPQKRYNWYTTELHSFKQLDGTISHGVLYKPENFDVRKQYPVIISFYTDYSDDLYQYALPDYVWSPLIADAPGWMASHGYLVFAPDIYFTQGQWGPSTVNTMDGAARYLKTLSYVDGKHLGAVGHSNSGRFGYYLLTHSKSFAAMCIGSGAADILSNALYMKPEGNKESMLYWAEVDAVGTGLGNLWQNKASWLDQTSVLHADKVTSPLLLFHNKKDGVPIAQATEMYIALRRLEKKCWWLQYDNGDHTLSDLGDLRDFTIRYTQYFDHYLKGAPAPRWMTQGIPAKLKGIESKYELAPSGTCALQGKNHCYICEAWNKQYKRNPPMFEKPISEWKLDDDLQKELDRKTTEERKKLDKEGLAEQKRIVEILKNGYPEDRKK